MIDIEKLLREGKSIDDIGNIVTAELKTAQNKIDEEAAAKVKEKELKERKEAVRKVAVAALKDYFALVCPKMDVEDLDKYANLTVDTMGETINRLSNVKVTQNGNQIRVDFGNLFDIFNSLF